MDGWARQVTRVINITALSSFLTVYAKNPGLSAMSCFDHSAMEAANSTTIPPRARTIVRTGPLEIPQLGKRAACPVEMVCGLSLAACWVR